jgi:hypothetical protein
MSAETTQIRYTGLTPGADALTYVIFDTTVAFPGARYAAEHKMKRLQVGLSNAAAGTYNWYKTQSRVTSTNTPIVWTQIGTAAVVAGATSENTNDFLIEEYADFKLEWVNGGAAQTTWVVDIALSGERVKST